MRGACARLQPAPGGSTRDRRLEARRRDSDRGSLEEEPEVAAGCSSPGEGRARGGSDPGRRRETSSSSGGTAPNGQADPFSSLGLEGVPQDPGMGGKGPWGATSLHPGGEKAGGSRSAGAGVCIPARVGCQSAPSPYHPGPKGGGGGQGTAELSLERDANRQSWEKSL
uniref:protein argonaute 12-like n=1 Tax=Ictidomys tridecemlineatus TaxID=43179 RepID=UPI001A9D9064|nr:protein argonaute 12-like [Ictidomys tridecemlineatus]